MSSQRGIKRNVLLLGGPPGVGKTTVIRHLSKSRPGIEVVDADDVWPPSQSTSRPDQRNLAISTVASTMRRRLETGCRLAILSWVFARSELYQPILDDLADVVDGTRLLYLVASAEALERRLRARGDAEKAAYAISRLDLIQQLPFRKIDTTFHSPAVTVAQILEEIRGWEAAGA